MDNKNDIDPNEFFFLETQEIKIIVSQIMDQPLVRQLIIVRLATKFDSRCLHLPAELSQTITRLNPVTLRKHLHLNYNCV